MILERTLSLPLALPRLIKAKLAKAETNAEKPAARKRAGFLASFERIMSAGVAPLVHTTNQELSDR